MCDDIKCDRVANVLRMFNNNEQFKENHQLYSHFFYVGLVFFQTNLINVCCVLGLRFDTRKVIVSIKRSQLTFYYVVRVCLSGDIFRSLKDEMNHPQYSNEHLQDLKGRSRGSTQPFGRKNGSGAESNLWQGVIQ